MTKANQNAPFGDAVQKCSLVPISKQVNIVRSSTGKIMYSGLKTCRSGWACSICTPRNMARKSEVVRAMNWLMPYTPVMVTYTIQHSNGEPLMDIANKLTSATRSARTGKRGKKYREVCHKYI